ncbi:hypothetical protein [Alteromonas ponticola]|uniref:Uncharacterized protein n=1 Tax=Alteromonas ponticola TaxID=2720613 RepID=A0ABX1R4M6_9ALTE|nr:hypothetical protein [Alteromonas ponticola]NMH60208.1 hypothetical protein [Alteromonas ponticola]
MEHKAALIVLERPWGYETSPNNKASVLPFFQGLQQLNGNFGLFHTHFYDKQSFEIALDEMLALEYDTFYLYIACHGFGRTLDALHLTSLLREINQQAKKKNIVGVVLGSCLLGENIQEFLDYSENSNIVWKVGFKCVINWLEGTFLAIKTFDTLMNAQHARLNNRDYILKKFALAYKDYRLDAALGKDRDDQPVPFEDSLTVVVQPRGKGKRAQDMSNNLFSMLSANISEL